MVSSARYFAHRVSRPTLVPASRTVACAAHQMCHLHAETEVEMLLQVRGQYMGQLGHSVLVSMYEINKTLC